MISYVDEVEVRNQTESNEEMWNAVNTMDEKPGFGEGHDEQTFLGLRTALEQANEHNFIVLFSDEPGNVTDLAIKQEVIDLKEKTESKIFFLVRPHANKRNNQTQEESLDSMKLNFNEIGTVIDITMHDKEETLTQIIEELTKSQICL